MPPCLACELLGVPTEINNSRREITTRPANHRIVECLEMLDQCISVKRIPAKLAKKLGGKLSFVVASLWGRYARCALRVIWNHLDSSSSRIVTAAEVLQLRFLRRLVSEAEPRVIQSCPTDDHRVVCWLDGSWANNTGGIGGCMVVVSHDMVVLSREYFSAEVPTNIRNHWMEHIKNPKRQQFNTQAEILATIVFLDTFPEAVRNRSIVLWEDNTATQHNCLRANPRAPLSSLLVTKFWERCKKYNVRVWLDRVDTKSNPGDNPSRFEYTLMEELKCTRREAVFADDLVKDME